MTEAPFAIHAGFTYQALVFWLHLLNLRADDYTETVCLECKTHALPFVDDIFVNYNPPKPEFGSYSKIDCEYIQCKYHMTHNGEFNSNNLIEPDFTGNKESMLKRLYNAYCELKSSNKNFVLTVYSNWGWGTNSKDKMGSHIEEDKLRDSFYKGGSRSDLGKIRKKFKENLGNISDDELKIFLTKVRFRIGTNQNHLKELLNERLKRENLKPIPESSALLIYDQLAWNWVKGSYNHFDNEKLLELLKAENLFTSKTEEHSEVSVSSFRLHSRRPRDTQDMFLNLLDLFDERFPKNDSYWNKEIPERLDKFLNETDFGNLKQPIQLFFDCHLSIAFYIGRWNSPKFSLTVIPTQKIGAKYQLWNQPDSFTENNWQYKFPDSFTKDTKEIALCISVTHSIESEVIEFLKNNNMNITILTFQPTKGADPKSISDGNHAWSLGIELAKILKDKLNRNAKINLFYSGPVALAYILGNTIRSHSNFQLYEYDFKPERDGSYHPSIKIGLEKEKK